MRKERKSGEGAEKWWCEWVTRLNRMDVGMHIRNLVRGRRVMIKENDAGNGCFGGGWCHF